MKTEEITKRIEEIEKELKDLRSKLSQDDKSVDLSHCGVFDTNGLIKVRSHGEYAEKSFFLSERYNWEIKRDLMDCLCLIPTKK